MWDNRGGSKFQGKQRDYIRGKTFYAKSLAGKNTKSPIPGGSGRSGCRGSFKRSRSQFGRISET